MKIEDNREGGFFWADNEIIDKYGAELGPFGIAVYMALSRHANRNRCFPSFGGIAKRIGASRPTVVKAIKKLEELGLISVERGRQTESGDWDSNVYILNRIDRGGKGDLPPSKGDLLGVVKDVYQGSKGGLHEQDYSNKTNSNNGGGEKQPPPPELTPAAQEYFSQFRRKRWATQEQRKQFTETEQQVGSEIMIDAVKWAAVNNIAKVAAICTTARKMSRERKVADKHGGSGGRMPMIGRGNGAK